MTDFFISYSSADRPWAEWIAWHLDAADYETFIEAWDLQAGTNFVLETDHAAQKADRTIVVLSPDYINSPRVQSEWAARFAEDPDGRNRSLILILVRETELRGHLKQITCIDLIGLDEEEAKRELLKGVSGLRTRPKRQPRFPGQARKEQGSAQDSKPDFPGEPELVLEMIRCLGHFVHKTCNRSKQAFDFLEACKNKLKNCFGTPQVYFIYGEEAQCHSSLVERLYYKEIKDLAEKKWGNEKGVPAFKRPKWVYGNNVIDLQRQLLAELFSEIGHDSLNEDFSVGELNKFLASSKHPLYIIQYYIEMTNWNNTTVELIRWYLKYWSDFQSFSNNPQFIIFICIIFPDTKNKFKWKQWLLLNKDKKKHVEKQLIDIVASHQTNCFCLMLEELSPIKPDEVKEWFRKIPIYPLKKMRRDAIERIFSDNGRMAEYKNMEDIEYELKLIVDSAEKKLLNKKGYL